MIGEKAFGRACLATIRNRLMPLSWAISMNGPDRVLMMAARVIRIIWARTTKDRVMAGSRIS